MHEISHDPMRVILFIDHIGLSDPLVQILARHGLEVFVAEDLESGLAEHQQAPFHLAIVHEIYKSRSASNVVQELLKIAWTTHAIIISSIDESELHEQMEGLGILGSIRDRHDLNRLGELLDKLELILGHSSH